MELLPEIDKDKTIANVIHFLNGHQLRVLRAGRKLSSLGSPKIDGMPKPPTATNNADKRIIERLEAEYEVDETYYAVSCLDYKSQKIIKDRWLIQYPKTNEQIARDLNYGLTRYQEIKKRALLMFAEAYIALELRVFKKR